MVPYFRSGYDEVENEVEGQEAGLRCEDISLTVQSEKEQADINYIVARALATGVAPQQVRMPLQGDFTEVGDFRECLEAVQAAQRSFAALSGPVRARFNGDPALFVDFCLDPANLEEARKLGLAVPAPEAAPIPAGAPQPA